MSPHAPSTTLPSPSSLARLSTPPAFPSLSTPLHPPPLTIPVRLLTLPRPFSACAVPLHHRRPAGASRPASGRCRTPGRSSSPSVTMTTRSSRRWPRRTLAVVMSVLPVILMLARPS
ncbi:hypothetical protein FRC08_018654 [Ceratobasidium sp. 394]|nr:hypothetical protein FRC08_018654 [Ceratobasidium sp. 394]